MVLGIAQDGGYPQAGCKKHCCRLPQEEPDRRRHVASLAVVDPLGKRRWIFDATPDLPEQLLALDRVAPVDGSPGLAGVFLTHAHVGHYTGLMHLGHEVMGADGVPVHVMPRMAEFLSSAGPWSQLVDFSNIVLEEMVAGVAVSLTPELRVTPLLVPHRDEFSETVAFRIDGPERSILFLPDIDKWESWEISIEDLLRDVDVAYVDGTFFDGAELPGRNLDKILHPFIQESMAGWAHLPEEIRSRVRFLHLNHTNPALDPDSDAAAEIRAAGFRLAAEGERVGL